MNTDSCNRAERVLEQEREGIVNFWWINADGFEEDFFLYLSSLIVRGEWGGKAGFVYVVYIKQYKNLKFINYKEFFFNGCHMSFLTLFYISHFGYVVLEIWLGTS